MNQTDKASKASTMKKDKLIVKLMLAAAICLVLQPFGARGQTAAGMATSNVQQATSTASPAAKPTQHPEVEESPPPGTTWTQLWLYYPQHAIPRNSNLRALLNVLCAIMIGWAGALAFLAGVRYGFISRTTRDKTLEFLANPPWWRLLDRSMFYLLGGIVAGVFQWAQPDTLAPIQAFVLGATWPSVVMRVMAGSSSPDTVAEKILATPPEKIATPAGKSATSAIVPI